jgi:hypothetical protein
MNLWNSSFNWDDKWVPYRTLSIPTRDSRPSVEIIPYPVFLYTLCANTPSIRKPTKEHMCSNKTNNLALQVASLTRHWLFDPLPRSRFQFGVRVTGGWCNSDSLHHLTCRWSDKVTKRLTTKLRQKRVWYATAWICSASTSVDSKHFNNNGTRCTTQNTYLHYALYPTDRTTGSGFWGDSNLLCLKFTIPGFIHLGLRPQRAWLR